MKRTQLLAILAFVCAIGLALPAVVGVVADDETATNQENTLAGVVEAELSATADGGPDDVAGEAAVSDQVTSEEQLLAALAESSISTITVTGNFTVNEDILINRDVVIDLAGHTISSNKEDSRVIDIQRGTVVLKSSDGLGIIQALGAGGCTVRITGSTTSVSGYSKLTVEAGVSLRAPQGADEDSYGLMVSYRDKGQVGKSYGVVVDFAGQIQAANGLYINGTIKDDVNYPIITIRDGAKVEATPIGTGIYAAGYGEWNIGEAVINGGSGIIIKSGTVETDGTTINATGAKDAEVDLNNNGGDVAGATFQIEKNENYAQGVVINIKGGTYTSANYATFHQYPTDKPQEDTEQTLSLARATLSSEPEITIYDGSFTPKAGEPIFANVDNYHAIIYGGSFSPAASDIAQISKYVAEGHNFNSTTGQVSQAGSSNPGGNTDGDGDEEDDPADGDEIVPGTNKPSSPNTGSAGDDDKGSKNSVVAAIVVGVLLVAGCWALYGIHRSRMLRLAEAKRASRKSSTRRSTAKKSTKAAKPAQSTAKRATTAKKTAKAPAKKATRSTTTRKTTAKKR